LEILEEVDESTNQKFFCVDFRLDLVVPVSVLLEGFLFPLKTKILALEFAQFELDGELCAFFVLHFLDFFVVHGFSSFLG